LNTKTRSKPLSIGAIAKRTGCAVSALRFYESEGLVSATRNAGGHRLFHRSTIRRISFILICQRLGYSLEEIKSVLSELPDGRTPTKADWQNLSRKFSDDIDERIALLSQLKESLTGCIGCGCLSLKACALYNPGDRAAVAGDGPRFLKGDKASDFQ